MTNQKEIEGSIIDALWCGIFPLPRPPPPPPPTTTMDTGSTSEWKSHALLRGWNGWWGERLEGWKVWQISFYIWSMQWFLHFGRNILEEIFWKKYFGKKYFGRNILEERNIYNQDLCSLVCTIIWKKIGFLSNFAEKSHIFEYYFWSFEN